METKAEEVIKLDKISDSKVDTFNTCRKKFYYAYVKCLTPKKKAKSLSFGGMFHAGMDGLYSKPLAEINIDYALKCVDRKVAKIDRSMFMQEDYDDLEWSEIVSKEMIKGVAKNWFKKDLENHVQVVEAEKDYIVPLMNPETGRRSKLFTFHIKTDMVLFVEGKLWLIENKTTSQMHKNLAIRLRIDKQSLNYMGYLQQIYGHKFEGVIFRYLKKPSIKRLKKVAAIDGDGVKIVIDSEGNRVLKKDGTPRQSDDKTKGYSFKYREETREEFYNRLEEIFTQNYDEYFIEHKLYVSQDDIKQAGQELWQVAQNMAYVIKHKLYDKNTKDCLMKNCPYLELCAGTMDEDDIDNMFTVKTEQLPVNEELEQED